jgi:hypothetical protein
MSLSDKVFALLALFWPLGPTVLSFFALSCSNFCHIIQHDAIATSSMHLCERGVQICKV